MSVTISGENDDTIRVTGDVTEEFLYDPLGLGQYLALSNGMVLHVELCEDMNPRGTRAWRITAVTVPPGRRWTLRPSLDQDSPKVTVHDTVSWVVLGDRIATATTEQVSAR